MCRGEKKGEATTHFQCGVATLQWCHDCRGYGVHNKCVCAHDRGPTPVRAGEPEKTCRTGLLGHSVATQNSLSRKRRLTLCRDRVLGS